MGQTGTSPILIRANFYSPKDYDLGHNVLEVDGGHYSQSTSAIF